MRDEDWFVSYIRCLAMLLDGRVMTEWADTGELIRDDAMLVLLNACWEEIPFTLPAIGEAINWHVLVDTTSGATASVILSRHARSFYALRGRSLALLSTAASETRRSFA